MKRLVLSCFLAVALLAVVNSAYAMMDGNKLLEKCEDYVSNPSSNKDSFCVAYITGIRHQYVLDRLLGKQVEMETFPVWHCIPDDAEDAQLAQAVVNFIKNNPDKLQYGAPVIVNLSFQDVWPCK